MIVVPTSTKNRDRTILKYAGISSCATAVINTGIAINQYMKNTQIPKDVFIKANTKNILTNSINSGLITMGICIGLNLIGKFLNTEPKVK